VTERKEDVPLERTSGEVTRLLASLRGPDADAAMERVLSLVYDELYALADHYLRHERPNHTLQPTALVNEAFVRLVGQQARVESRGHFLAIAATVMRRVLVNHARDRARLKRGSGVSPGTLMTHDVADLALPTIDVLALHEAMESLGALDRRKEQIVEMRFLVGMSEEEIAEVLSVSVATVRRDWRFARAWLRSRMAGTEHA